MKPDVEIAVREIALSFQGSPMTTTDDGSGGAIIVLKDVSLQDGPFEQDQTWIGFHITHTYPYSDIYPHFVRADLKRKDGKPLGEATSLGTFQGNPAVQLSRRGNHHNPATDTACLKLHKVLRWLKSR
jgi:hypothetical protein